MKYDIELFPYQYDFIKCTAPTAALLAGVATGKTLTIAYKILDHIAKYPKSKILLCANTYSQLINATLEPLFSVLDNLAIPYEKSLTNKYIKILDTKVYTYSLEKYDTIRGIEVGLILVDEGAFASKLALNVIRTRLRCKHGPLQFRLVSTKNGFNHIYYDYASPLKKEGYQLFEAQTSDNTVLSPQFIEDLAIDYGSTSSPLFKQEVLNQFVNTKQGSVYYSFDRKVHVGEGTLESNKHVYVGVDFNIDNMNAVFVQIHNDEVYVLKEICLKESDSNTFVLRERLLKELSNYNYRSIVADSTGRARKTSAHKSDHELLREVGFKLEKTNNPLIRDRQNAVNKQFHINKLYVDKSCKTLIKELETLSSREREGDHAHISVALGYVIAFLKPIKKRARSTQYNPYN